MKRSLTCNEKKVEGAGMCKGPEAWLVCLRNEASEKESKGEYNEGRG